MHKVQGDHLHRWRLVTGRAIAAEAALTSAVLDLQRRCLHSVTMLLHVWNTPVSYRYTTNAVAAPALAWMFAPALSQNLNH